MKADLGELRIFLDDDEVSGLLKTKATNKKTKEKQKRKKKNCFTISKIVFMFLLKRICIYVFKLLLILCYFLLYLKMRIRL